MEPLLKLLSSIEEYNLALAAIQKGESAAITGIGQINRSHLLAGFKNQCGRPLVVICQDDLAAKRIQEELKSFLGEVFPILPGRDLTLYDAAVVSRSWEQKRLRQLYDLAQGKTPVQILSWEALSLRTIPKNTLLEAAFSMTVGQEHPVGDLVSRLLQLGYSRCAMVEGVGQFALRGGILDIFSPGQDQPFRCEFFGDELDTMGFFDPQTQRRSENADSVTILPVAETLPGLHPQGICGLCDDLKDQLARQKRRKHLNEKLIATLERDLETFENGSHHSAADRYMALIYPEMATALQYIPDHSLVAVLDHSSCSRSAAARQEEMGLLLDSFLESGLVSGQLCDYVCSWEDFCDCLPGKAVLYMDAFGGAAYPEACLPKHLLPMSAKQLPGYAGNLETAASDLKHYQST